MKLLIAHDGSPQSDAMVAELSRCGLPEAGQAVVLTVADAWTAADGDAAPAFAGAVAGAGASVIRAAIEQARATAEGAREAVAARLPGWRVEAQHVAGSPAWEIIRKADEWQPELVIVGATGASRLERFVFGTTTSQVVGHARCSVRVSRPRPDANGPVRLVIGCDGSPVSLDAARQVARRRWPEGSVARVVTAIDSWLLAALAEADGATDEDARRRAEELPSLVEPVLRSAGLSVESVVEDGDPKQLLVDQADDWGADCIFIGPRGRRGLARLLLGSVALAAASRARCSVEVVRVDGGTL